MSACFNVPMNQHAHINVFSNIISVIPRRGVRVSLNPAEAYVTLDPLLVYISLFYVSLYWSI